MSPHHSTITGLIALGKRVYHLLTKTAKYAQATFPRSWGIAPPFKTSSCTATNCPVRHLTAHDALVGKRVYHHSRQLFCGPNRPNSDRDWAACPVGRAWPWRESADRLVPITPQLLARLHLVNESTITHDNYFVVPTVHACAQSLPPPLPHATIRRQIEPSTKCGFVASQVPTSSRLS